MTCPEPDCKKAIESDIKEFKGTIKWGVGLIVAIVLAFATAYGMTRKEINTNTIKIAVIMEKIDTLPTKGELYKAIKRIKENDD